MRNKLITIIAALTLVFVLPSCSSNEPIGKDTIAPITVNLNELDGSEFNLLINQVLNINTGEIDPSSFAADFTDQNIVSFENGSVSETMTTNPGFTANNVGSTQITLSSSDINFTEKSSFRIIVSE